MFLSEGANKVQAVGSDERHSELYLRLLVEQLHGVKLTQHDCEGRPSAVDYVFVSHGASGAVEMTTVQDSRATAWAEKLGGGEIIECDSPRGWTVVVDLSTRLDQLRMRLPSVVIECDRHGVSFPEHLPVDAREDEPNIGWFLATKSRLFPVESGRKGIRVQMPAVAAFPKDAGINQDLARLLLSPAIGKKLVKLRKHPDVTERHLAIGVVDVYGPGFDLLSNLKFERCVTPDWVPPESFSATHVWITGGSTDVLAWSRPEGWQWRALQGVGRA